MKYQKTSTEQNHNHTNKDKPTHKHLPLSRRNFLQGSGVLAAGTLGTSLLAACSPQTKSSNISGNLASSITYTDNAGKTMGDVLGAGWLGEEPNISAKDIAASKSASIVICGAGHAGSACARHAAELGAQVILLESQAQDTFKALGNDIGHLNSSWQTARKGIPHYDPIKFMNEYQIYGAGRVQPTLLNQFAYRSGEAFDWFINDYTESEKDNLAVLNWPVVEGYQYQRGLFTSYVGTAQFSGTIDMTTALQRSQEKATKAGATIVFDQKAVRLVHEHGEVTGLIAQASDGTYTQYKAEAVVLSCGDIGSNTEMYNAICRENYELGEYADCQSMSGRDGSGIAMGMRMGAKVEIGTGGDMGSHAFIPLSPLEGIECLWLNKYGKRYCNEAFGGPLLSGCAGARQPGDKGYVIWDSNWKEVFYHQLAGHLAPKEWTAENEANIQNYLDAALKAGKEGDDTSGKFLYCANTLEELCDWMGMESGVKANCLAAVTTWNAAHDKGFDDEFGREAETMWPITSGPFYGFPCSKHVGGGSLVSTSGLLVSGEQQVQGQGFEPIKGLFACGNNSGGRFPMGYNGIMNGVSIGMCLTLGYTLGEYLATASDVNQYCTLGSQSSTVKESDKGIGGAPPA